MGIIFALLKAICFGFFTGFSISIPLGPAALESVNRSISKGFRQGFKVSIGAVLGDFTILIIVNIGLLKFLVTSPTSEGVFWIFSGCLLLVFSYFNSKCKTESKIIAKISSNPRMGGFFAGYLMTILNPTSISLWMAVSSTIFTLWLQNGIFYFLCSIASMFVGSLSWFTCLNLLASKGVKLLKKDISKGTSKLLTVFLSIIGIAFVFYGVYKFCM